MTNTLKKAGLRNKVAGAIAGLNAAWMMTVVAMADMGPWTAANGALTNILTQLEAALKSIVVPIAGVALIFCFIMMLVSQNQKKVESYRSWCITIVICIVAIYAVPFIIKIAQQVGQSFNA